MVEFDVNSIKGGVKYLNIAIARYNRAQSIDNPNKNSIRSHLIVNTKLAIKFNDGKMNSVSLLILLHEQHTHPKNKDSDSSDDEEGYYNKIRLQNN